MVKKIRKKKRVKHYRPARRVPVRVSRRAAGPVMGNAHGSRERVREGDPSYGTTTSTTTTTTTTTTV